MTGGRATDALILGDRSMHGSIQPLVRHRMVVAAACAVLAVGTALLTDHDIIGRRSGDARGKSRRRNMRHLQSLRKRNAPRSLRLAASSSSRQ